MYLTRNQAYVKSYRGFESHPLRQVTKNQAPLGSLFFCCLAERRRAPARSPRGIRRPRPCRAVPPESPLRLSAPGGQPPRSGQREAQTPARCHPQKRPTPARSAGAKAARTQPHQGQGQRQRAALAQRPNTTSPTKANASAARWRKGRQHATPPSRHTKPPQPRIPHLRNPPPPPIMLPHAASTVTGEVAEWSNVPDSKSGVR
jgi:hypothetical protein